MSEVYKGIIEGTVTEDARYAVWGAFSSAISFMIKLSKEIPGIPPELPVYWEKLKNISFHFSTGIKKGDKVTIEGKIVKKTPKAWKKDIFLIRAENIYNQTIQYGL